MPNSSEREILERLKSEPYYSVRISPTRPLDVISLPEARRAVSDNAVRLRGWDFPHAESGTIYNGDNHVFSSVDWNDHVEFWRMYQSRQFVYLGASWDTGADHQEQLMRELPRMIAAHESVRESVVGLLSFIGIIYSVTEYFVFASRLANVLEYPASVRLDVALHNVEKWALGGGDPRVHWSFIYQSHIPVIRISPPKALQLITENDAVAAARDGLIELFSRFNWDNSVGAIDSWQKQLIERRF